MVLSLYRSIALRRHVKATVLSVPTGASLFALNKRFNSDGKDKGVGFDKDNVDGGALNHPYWESAGPDDFGLLDELQEFGDDIDFDLSEEDKEFLKNEWKK